MLNLATRTRVFLIVANFGAVCLGLSACVASEPTPGLMTPEQRLLHESVIKLEVTATGTISGALSGAIIGYRVAQEKGALIGAAIGAAVGGTATYLIAEYNFEREQTAENYATLVSDANLRAHDFGEIAEFAGAIVSQAQRRSLDLGGGPLSDAQYRENFLAYEISLKDLEEQIIASQEILIQLDKIVRILSTEKSRPIIADERSIHVSSDTMETDMRSLRYVLRCARRLNAADLCR